MSYDFDQQYKYGALNVILFTFLQYGIYIYIYIFLGTLDSKISTLKMEGIEENGSTIDPLSSSSSDQGTTSSIVLSSVNNIVQILPTQVHVKLLFFILILIFQGLLMFLGSICNSTKSAISDPNSHGKYSPHQKCFIS